jgi:hypothetical protein
MSRRTWNSYKERDDVVAAITENQQIMEAMATILDADDDILDVMIHLAANNLELEEELIWPIEDEGIEWGRRCLLEDVSDSDAISNF